MPTMSALTANEAAAASRIPLKQVHRIIDAGLLDGAVDTRDGTRMIEADGLLALKLAYVTADLLKPAARRRAVLRLLSEPDSAVIRDHVVTVEVAAIGADLESGLADLDAARVMVATDPDILGGTPCFAGTRVPVHDIAERLAQGDATEDLLADHPALDAERLRLAVVYAAAYPRRGRPPVPPWRSGRPVSREVLRLDDLPVA